MTPTSGTTSAENDDAAANYENDPCRSAATSRKNVVPRLDAEATSKDGGRLSGDLRSIFNGLPPVVIQRIIREKYPLFRACYDDALQRDRHLKGSTCIRFVIEGDGKVSHVKLESSDIGDAEFRRCLNDRSKDLYFPQMDGGTVTVAYPLRFSPEQ
jgi:hypothetical protein